jgi:hypothetical protein
MKISPAKKIIPEDFPSESRSIILKLSVILNQFLDQVSQILMQGVTLRDNTKSKIVNISLKAEVKDINGTVIQVAETTKSFAWDLNEKPTAIYVGQITKDTSKVALSAIYSMFWTTDGKNITVSFVGLDPTKPHDVSIVCLV